MIARPSADLHELGLPRPSGLVGLREPGRDHHERPDALPAAGRRHLDDPRRRDGDDRQVHRTRNVLYRGVGGHRLDDVRGGVHRIDGPGKLVGQEIVEDFSPNRPTLSRGADDRDGPRVEERAERVGRGHSLTLVKSLHRFFGQHGREGFVNLSGLHVHFRREAGVAEHLQHPHITG